MSKSTQTEWERTALLSLPPAPWHTWLCPFGTLTCLPLSGILAQRYLWLTHLCHWVGTHWLSSNSSWAQGPQRLHNVAILCCPKETWCWSLLDGALDSGTSSVPTGWRPLQPGCVDWHTSAWLLWKPGLGPSLLGNGPGHRVGSHTPRDCPAALQKWKARGEP